LLACAAVAWCAAWPSCFHTKLALTHLCSFSHTRPPPAARCLQEVARHAENANAHVARSLDSDMKLLDMRGLLAEMTTANEELAGKLANVERRLKSADEMAAQHPSDDD
jgi:hypothetical protein